MNRHIYGITRQGVVYFIVILLNELVHLGVISGNGWASIIFTAIGFLLVIIVTPRLVVKTRQM
ncbi:hypothetical protein JVU11DRAFT_8134 [Chiua virens]|nr:hypothetical protein JVU11DRAFT_8134 [Chiua virens]